MPFAPLMSTPPRVVITGMGAVTPLGTSVAAFWGAILRGESGITRISAFDPGKLRSQIAGEVKVFDPLAAFQRPKGARHTDRYCHFAMAAAREAMLQSGLGGSDFDADRAAVVIGSSNGGMTSLEQQFRVLSRDGVGRLSPFAVPMFRNNMAAGLVATDWGFQGPSVSVTAACATASQSLAEACRLIRSGEADVVLAGGSEAPICELLIGAFCAMRALSTRNESPEAASRPFDRNRDGFVIAEGAGILLLETEAHARKRGAHILAELAGHGGSTNSRHLTQPEPDGTAVLKAMSAALTMAQCAPKDLTGVFAHATGTPSGDKAEADSLTKLLRGRRVPVTAVKSMTGHLCGASGAIEVIAAVKSIEGGILPPTRNLFETEPGTGLDHVTQEARETPVEKVLCNAFGFGGTNASLVVKRYP
jgi:3-oxoacyl-[acyl-carrier-protein] synthase II